MSSPVAFHYQAVHLLDRTRREGLIEALSEREARERLREQDLIPTHLAALSPDDAPDQPVGNGATRWLKRFVGVGLREKIAFSRSLGMMLKAGVPIAESLAYLETFGTNPAFQRLLGRIRQDVLAGAPFAEAIQRQAPTFDPVYCAVIRAGEASGELVAALARMTDLLQRAQRLQAKLVSSSVYPVTLITLVLAVFGLLILYVLPVFEVIYDRMDVAIPWPTAVFLGLSQTLRAAWWVWLPLIAGAIYFSLRQILSPGTRQALQRRAMRLPWVGELLRLVSASHFLSTLSVAVGAGVPITEALTLAAHTVGNATLRESLAPVSMRIQAGERLTAALAKSGVLGEIELLMIASGEESGELDTMLRNAFEFVEEALNQRLDMLMTLMEPLALALIGLIVAAMALAIYLPMFSLYQSL